MSEAAEEGRHRLEFFPVAIGHYAHHDNLDVQAEVDAIAEILAPFGATPLPWNTAMADRDRGMIEIRMQQWHIPSTPADTFVYWVGHGWGDGRSATLAHTSSPAQLSINVITPGDFARWIIQRAASRHGADTWSIVVIEACRSGDFVTLVSSALDAEPQASPRVLLVGATGGGLGGGATRLGAFRIALESAVRNTFRASPTIALWALGQELDRTLDAVVRPKHIPDATLYRRSITPAGIAVDVAEHLQELLAELPAAERLHFLPKAQGAELGEVAWFFEGRQQERRRICDWLHSRADGMFVVTGAPGSGKSALLGHLAVTSRPALRTALIRAGHLPDLPEPDRPPDDIFDAVLHLTGASADALLRDITAAAHLDDLPQGASLHELTAHVIERLAARAAPFTVVLDALDEAQQPLLIARQILRPLAAVEGVRLIIGTRASTMHGPDQSGSAVPDLLPALAPAPDQILHVKMAPEAIHRYVHRRLNHLLADHTEAFSNVAERHTAIGWAARLIADGRHEFLFARLAVHELHARPELLAADRRDDLVTVLSGDHRRLFASAVARHRAVNPARALLLQALGLAQGRGLPIVDGIWAAVADALRDAADPEISGGDIDDLIAAAAPYLMVDVEFGQTVYRLAHATFAEHFTTTTDLLPAGPRHRRIVTRLITHAERPTAESVNVYLSTYLAAHAAHGGHDAWQDLADHPRILDALNPRDVAVQAFSNSFDHQSLPIEIIGVIGMQHLLCMLPYDQRIGLRQLGSARHAGTTRPNTLDQPSSTAQWSLRWARIRQVPLHLTMTGHTGEVNALVAFTRADGRPL
ncbi:AAA family ATPase, partial [Streptosporangium canum]|uniref:AAA family ATPase n=1 Tax=Streptosporangium canum TaxID=324952 RepID=UPI00367CF297